MKGEKASPPLPKNRGFLVCDFMKAKQKEIIKELVEKELKKQKKLLKKTMPDTDVFKEKEIYIKDLEYILKSL
mgnify:CR=1 FL=1